MDLGNCVLAVLLLLVVISRLPFASYTVAAPISIWHMSLFMFFYLCLCRQDGVFYFNRGPLSLISWHLMCLWWICSFIHLYFIHVPDILGLILLLIINGSYKVCFGSIVGCNSTDIIYLGLMKPDSVGSWPVMSRSSTFITYVPPSNSSFTLLPVFLFSI